MEWYDRGLILETRKYSERDLILTTFSASHGLYRGFFTPPKKERLYYQQGALIQVRWKARLSEHLGRFFPEFITNPLVPFFTDRTRLAAARAYSALLSQILAERHPYPHLWSHFFHFLSTLHQPQWMSSYVFLELKLLRDIGFGLHLERCVVTGKTSMLSYVSPRTGRAVCDEVAHAYKDKLLPLPLFLHKGTQLQNTPPSVTEILRGLHLTGYFLERVFFQQLKQYLPIERTWFIKFLQSTNG